MNVLVDELRQEDSPLTNRAADEIETLRRNLVITIGEATVATLETAVLTIIKAVQTYLPPDSGVSKDQFIAEVLGAVDNAKVFEALERAMCDVTMTGTYVSQMAKDGPSMVEARARKLAAEARRSGAWREYLDEAKAQLLAEYEADPIVAISGALERVK